MATNARVPGGIDPNQVMTCSICGSSCKVRCMITHINDFTCHNKNCLLHTGSVFLDPFKGKISPWDSDPKVKRIGPCYVRPPRDQNRDRGEPRGANFAPDSDRAEEREKRDRKQDRRRDASVPRGRDHRGDHRGEDRPPRADRSRASTPPRRRSPSARGHERRGTSSPLADRGRDRDRARRVPPFREGGTFQRDPFDDDFFKRSRDRMDRSFYGDDPFADDFFQHHHPNGPRPMRDRYRPDPDSFGAADYMDRLADRFERGFGIRDDQFGAGQSPFGRTAMPGGGDRRERGPYPGGPTRTSRPDPYHRPQEHQGRNRGQTGGQRTRRTREEPFRYEWPESNA
ncbi:uncharacterized protein B0T15DRAFT_490139 [Chaetomium strumarium]|uniref:Uncharacterized protein n=1 Tax=Chaetomium strumarium TaxID=1170767 RepID=A0AAJ0H4V4_9PEZI|nr:hypothetical protein B0T15DRAFT_490139 [Chaetomium strumarium]